MEEGLEEDMNFIPLHLFLQGSEARAQTESIQSNHGECSLEVAENREVDDNSSSKSRFNT